MAQSKAHREVDERFLKLTIGLIAIMLPILTWVLSVKPLHSISASYYEIDLARNIFVGGLFAISALLMSYDGRTGTQRVLSKVAAVAAPLIASFPCQCHRTVTVIPYIHEISASVMFAILAWFCYIFWQHALSVGNEQAKLRVLIYRLCFAVIVISMAAAALDTVLGGRWSGAETFFIFACEACGLVAFGISWLTASKWISWTASENERYSLFPSQKPMDATR